MANTDRTDVAEIHSVVFVVVEGVQHFVHTRTRADRSQLESEGALPGPGESQTRFFPDKQPLERLESYDILAGCNRHGDNNTGWR